MTPSYFISSAPPMDEEPDDCEDDRPYPMDYYPVWDMETWSPTYSPILEEDAAYEHQTRRL